MADFMDDVKKNLKALEDDLNKVAKKRAGGSESQARSDIRAAAKKRGVTLDDKEVRKMAKGMTEADGKK